MKLHPEEIELLKKLLPHSSIRTWIEDHRDHRGLDINVYNHLIVRVEREGSPGKPLPKKIGAIWEALKASANP